MLAFNERLIVDEQIKQWLKNDIISEETSDFAAPLVLEKRKTVPFEHALIIENSIKSQ